jgi:LmbE family N-acetylglucosaminyl deacetylase
VTPLAPGLVPLPLPHYRLRDDGLYFLVSRRPALRLEAAEREVWCALDGAATVADLERRFPAAAGPALRRFVDAGLCLPVEPEFPAGRRRIAVFEPHMDDAVLSLGGTLWRRRHECEFTIVTVAGVSNFTSYYYLDHDYFDVRQVSDLRCAESAVLARAVGGRHVALDRLEAPLRFRDGNWTPDWFHRHHASISAFIGRAAGPAEIRDWAEALRASIANLGADELWLPLGNAPHTDHELMRNAFLRLLEQDPTLLHRAPVRLYQEVPYAARVPHATAHVLAELAAQGARLAPEASPLAGDDFAAKLRLVALFGSQFKLAAMQADVEASARSAAGAGGGLAELLYRLEAPPRAPDFLALSVVAPEVRALADALGPWLTRNRRARRVRVFLRPPAGRWAEDAAALLEALPEARLIVRAAQEALVELEDFHSPRVEVASIGRGAAAWGLAMLRATLAGPAPTLLVTFPALVRQGRQLARLLPGSDTLVVPSMNHLALALRLLGEERAEG